MSELIRWEGNKPIIATEVIQKFAEGTAMMKKIEDQQKEMKEKLLKEIEAHGITEIEADTDRYISKIKYIAPTTRTVLDTKALQRDFASICNAYLKDSEVKASLRITVKEK